MSRPQLTVVTRDPSNSHRRATAATALEFSETVRTVVALSRRGRLVVPVFRSPPRVEDVDRTIRWRSARSPVVAIRRTGRPLAAIQSDVIEAVVVANDLPRDRADRFRHAAWSALQGTGGSPQRMARVDTVGDRDEPAGGDAPGSERVA
ncbi:MAG: hypothetical protein GY812_09515 [Actinomycetia bacterium]|nr:hypothetical protein [Actinomycetes bacterium]